LVPARVRVVVPYFPSPESLLLSFGAFHRGDLTAFAAIRLSSSGPEGPSDSVRQAPLVSFCSARDPRATPWLLSPRALVELGRCKSSLQRPGASPRGQSSRPTPRPSPKAAAFRRARRMVPDSTSPVHPLSMPGLHENRDRPRFAPTPEPPFVRSPEGDRHPKGRCLPSPPNPRVFHGPSDRSLSGRP
jgi:hypothetical protein